MEHSGEKEGGGGRKVASTIMVISSATTDTCRVDYLSRHVIGVNGCKQVSVTAFGRNSVMPFKSVRDTGKCRCKMCFLHIFCIIVVTFFTIKGKQSSSEDCAPEDEKL